MKKRFVLLALLSVGAHSYAQETEKAIEEVSLQGKFLSLPLKNVNENSVVITREEIKASAAQTVDELLQQTLGVDLQRRGAGGMQGDLSIRGGSFEQTLILINGIRMNDAQTGHNSLHLPVDLQFIERIEIVKGPAARRFGNNAFSGVVNIITKTTGENKLILSAQAGDYSSYQLSAGAQLSGEKSSHLIQGGVIGSEGYRHNTDFVGRNVFYQGSIPISQGKISVQGGFSERKFGANGFYATPSATEQYEETQASLVSAALEKTLGKIDLKSNLYWRRGQDLYLYDRENPSFYRNMHIGNSYGAEISVGTQSKLGYTGVGLELRQEDLSSNNLGARNRFLTQGFLEHHFSFLDGKLELVPGLTWANFSSVGSFFYPGIDVGVNLSNEHKVYANVSRVHRVPTFTDLYYVSKTEIGNPNLSPENAVSYELGYRFRKGGFLGKLSGFGRETNNGIDWVKASAEDLWEAKNVGKISTKGVEAELSYRTEGMINSYSIGYTYIDQDLAESEGMSKYVLDHLKHQLIANVGANLTPKLGTGVTYRYQERANNYSYHLVDLKASYDFRPLSVYVLVNNLTNTQYKEAFGVPMSGRWFHVGANLSIQLRK